MSKTIPIPFSVLWLKNEITRLNGEQIEFPDKCVYCGSPREKFHQNIIFTMSKREGTTNLKVNNEFKIPYCKKHSQQSYWNTGLIISLYGLFAFGFLIPGYYLFQGTDDTFHISFGVILWFFGAVIMAIIATMIVNAALSSMRKSLKDQSLSHIFSNAGDLGIQLEFINLSKPNEKENYILKATFANEAYADEFEKLNAPKE
jgi:hypothetical protein